MSLALSLRENPTLYRPLPKIVFESLGTFQKIKHTSSFVCDQM